MKTLRERRPTHVFVVKVWTFTTLKIVISVSSMAPVVLTFCTDIIRSCRNRIQLQTLVAPHYQCLGFWLLYRLPLNCVFWLFIWCPRKVKFILRVFIILIYGLPILILASVSLTNQQINCGRLGLKEEKVTMALRASQQFHDDHISKCGCRLLLMLHCRNFYRCQKNTFVVDGSILCLCVT